VPKVPAKSAIEYEHDLPAIVGGAAEMPSPDLSGVSFDWAAFEPILAEAKAGR